MSEPLVCAVMLTKDRPEMAKRAVECFRKQTYQNKRILVVNSGPKPLFTEATDLREPCFVGIDALTIGALRNHAARYASSHYTTRDDCPEIFIHWDDDDYSHPNRIAEQVALLQSSGKQCVGYREMLFWKEPWKAPRNGDWEDQHEAWLYRNNDPRYCLGTSLCYWREVWEKRPFKDVSRGEDFFWLQGVDSLGVSSWTPNISDPRMIASIHSGNHVVYQPEKTPAFTRAAYWDEECRRIMAL